jgi:CheY-like chemotaxis protein
MVPQLSPLVLVVDDYDDTRVLYEEILKQAGFRVVGAADAGGAIRAARDRNPDVVLMDVGMEGINGFEAVTVFKSDPKLAAVPILMLTAHVFPEHEKRAAQVGAVGFIRKPCAPHVILSEISRVLAPS